MAEIRKNKIILKGSWDGKSDKTKISENINHKRFKIMNFVRKKKKKYEIKKKIKTS